MLGALALFIESVETKLNVGPLCELLKLEWKGLRSIFLGGCEGLRVWTIYFAMGVNLLSSQADQDILGDSCQVAPVAHFG